MAASVIGYLFNTLAGRFVAPNGRFVSLPQVRDALDSALDAAGAEARSIAAAYSAGRIGVPEFERQMQQLIKDTQIYASAVGAGGFQNIGVNELALVQRRIGEQFAYLSDLSDDLAANIRISSGQLAARAKLYALSATNTFDVTYRAGQAARGFNQERNILQPGESCSSCIHQSALGWVPIGTLIPIGQRTCLGNCNCGIEYRIAA